MCYLVIKDCVFIYANGMLVDVYIRTFTKTNKQYYVYMYTYLSP